MKITKRQLAARFVDALETTPIPSLSTAVVEVAIAAGFGHDDLTGLIAAIEQELQMRFGLAEIHVTTAHELPEAALTELATQVAAAAGLRNVDYTHEVNPDLLGGFDAQAGDLSFHNSIRERLTALEVSHG